MTGSVRLELSLLLVGQRAVEVGVRGHVDSVLGLGIGDPVSTEGALVVGGGGYLTLLLNKLLFSAVNHILVHAARAPEGLALVERGAQRYISHHLCLTAPDHVQPCLLRQVCVRLVRGQSVVGPSSYPAHQGI